MEQKTVETIVLTVKFILNIHNLFSPLLQQSTKGAQLQAEYHDLVMRNIQYYVEGLNICLLYENCMQMPKIKKGLNLLKPLPVLCGPTWARTRDPLIMSHEINKTIWSHINTYGC